MIRKFVSTTENCCDCCKEWRPTDARNPAFFTPFPRVDDPRAHSRSPSQPASRHARHSASYAPNEYHGYDAVSEATAVAAPLKTSRYATTHSSSLAGQGVVTRSKTRSTSAALNAKRLVDCVRRPLRYCAMWFCLRGLHIKAPVLRAAYKFRSGRFCLGFGTEYGRSIDRPYVVGHCGVCRRHPMLLINQVAWKSHFSLRVLFA